MSTDNTQHTPTPWKYSFQSVNPEWAIVTDAGGLIVANVNTRSGPDTASVPAERVMPAEHNAAFIVKAVNSYDADKAAIRKLREALITIAAAHYDNATGVMARAALEETKEAET